jgi:hypothetical protein
MSEIDIGVYKEIRLVRKLGEKRYNELKKKEKVIAELEDMQNRLKNAFFQKSIDRLQQRILELEEELLLLI